MHRNSTRPGPLLASKASSSHRTGLVRRMQQLHTAWAIPRAILRGVGDCACVNSLSAVLSRREFETGVLRCTAGHSGVSSGPPERVRTGRESEPSLRKRESSRSSGTNGATRERPQQSCVKRRRADVLLTKKSGSPEDTDRISRRGPRIKHLDAVVRDPEWCPVAITNSLS
jgi:hypothetical protein